MRGIALAIVSFVLLSCKRSEVKLDRNAYSVKPVIVALPETASVEVKETFSGIVLADVLTPVLPDVPGRFTGYTVSEGQFVSKDATIGYVDRKLPGMDFRKHPVKAPVSGYIHLLDVKPGQKVSPNTPLAQIYMNKFVEVELPSSYYHKVALGERMEILDRDTLESRIYFKSSVIDPRTQTFKVRAKVRNIPLGKVVKVRLTIERTDGSLTVPTEAVMGLDRKFVFVVSKGRAYKRIVEVGISNEKLTQVISGLSAKDTVVVQGNRVLYEGDSVKIVERR